MATSKLPIYFIPVPENIINFAKQHEEVLCNLRPEQRKRVPAVTVMEKRRERIKEITDSVSDNYWVDRPVMVLLKLVSAKIQLTKKSVRVALHFQGYGEEDIGTAVVDITNVYWTEDDYPRLDFIHPEEMKKIHGCPNFWGAFILAITETDSEMLFAKPDRTGEEFMTAFIHGRRAQCLT